MTIDATTDAGSARLEAVLGRVRGLLPGPVEQARRALDAVLEGVRGSNRGELAWRSSPLTDDGFPVEFAWSSAERSLSWTAEAAGPEVPGAERLATALAAYGRLAGGALDFVAAPPTIPRFGAWVGGRHAEGRDDFSLYVETSAAPRECEAALWAAEAALGRSVAPRTLRVEADGRLELYGRAERISEAGVMRLFALAGDAAGPEAVIRALAGGEGVRKPVPRTGVIGLAFQDGELRGVAWSAPAQLVCGGEALVAGRLGRASALAGGDLRLHRALVGPDGPLSGCHGMVSVGLPVGGAAYVQIAVRPGMVETGEGR